MKRLFEQTGPNHADFIKEAFLPLLAKGLMGRAGKTIVKHPLKSVGAGLTVMDSGTSMSKMNKLMSDASSGGHNLASRVGSITM